MDADLSMGTPALGQPILWSRLRNDENTALVGEEAEHGFFQNAAGTGQGGFNTRAEFLA